MEKPQKLWQKDYALNEQIEQFTVGNDRELDLQLARFDVLGSLAHVKMLEKTKLISKDDCQAICKELRAIFQTIAEGNFSIAPGIEDVHSQVEIQLTNTIGDAGKRLHTGRSRNDQVLVDLKLFIRENTWQLAEKTATFSAKLLAMSEKHKDVLIPGYTHLQVAMPSSMGLWFGAYAESLVDDAEMMLAAYRIANKNPLGSAAGYGSSFPLDRAFTTQLLGFETLNFNVVYAQMGRGKTELVFAQALAALAATLNKFATDIALYVNQNFGIFSLSDEVTTGSSIMPHKKNPDIFEIMRGRTNLLCSLPQQVLMLTSNLPSGYHREMQLLKEVIFPAINHTHQCLDMAILALDHLKIRENIMEDAFYDYLFTVEEVNKLVLNGTPFREAYQIVGQQVASGQFKTDRKLQHTHQGSIGNLCNKEIAGEMQKVIARFGYQQAEAKMMALLKDD